MRLLPLALFVAYILLPHAAAQGPIVPQLTLELNPVHTSVNSTSLHDTNVTFEGTAKLEKLPLVRAVVDLSSQVDMGWASEVSPSSMVFTSSGSQNFTVVVVVPSGTRETEATLRVDGRAVCLGLQDTTTVTAVIAVLGAPDLNSSLQNTTGKNGSASWGQGGSGTGAQSWTSYALPGGAAAVIVASAAGLVVWRKRRFRAAPGVF
ncbi:MAG: hypothetical protein QXD84_05485 [Thermoplasmata archaeon]